MISHNAHHVFAPNDHNYFIGKPYSFAHVYVYERKKIQVVRKISQKMDTTFPSPLSHKRGEKPFFRSFSEATVGRHFTLLTTPFFDRPQ